MRGFYTSHKSVRKKTYLRKNVNENEVVRPCLVKSRKFSLALSDLLNYYRVILYLSTRSLHIGKPAKLARSPG